jgi:hypothetical protein
VVQYLIIMVRCQRTGFFVIGELKIWCAQKRAHPTTAGKNVMLKAGFWPEASISECTLRLKTKHKIQEDFPGVIFLTGLPV